MRDLTAIATKILRAVKVYNLPGGFQAWEKAGKPVEK